MSKITNRAGATVFLTLMAAVFVAMCVDPAAAATSSNNIFVNAFDNVGSTGTAAGKAITLLAFPAGALMAIAGLNNARKRQNNPNETSAQPAMIAMLVVVGVVLMGFGWFSESGIQSLLGDDAELGSSTGFTQLQ